MGGLWLHTEFHKVNWDFGSCIIEEDVRTGQIKSVKEDHLLTEADLTRGILFIFKA
jgi:hypothetical protein